MTKREIYDELCNYGGCITCGRVSNINGNNASYVSINIDDLIDDSSMLYFLDDVYNLHNCHQVKSNEIDIDEWAQELLANCVNSLRDELNNGNLYMAEYTDEKNRYYLLFWK